jgi:hypothetical protein
VAGAGHHRVSFDVVKSRMAKLRIRSVTYFDRCRRKRNVIDYDDAFVATETEAKEVVTKTREFVEVVEQWIAKNHPSLNV